MTLRPTTSLPWNATPATKPSKGSSTSHANAYVPPATGKLIPNCEELIPFISATLPASIIATSRSLPASSAAGHSAAKILETIMAPTVGKTASVSPSVRAS